jgi:hypothetical protein
MPRAAFMIATTLVLAGCGNAAGGPDRQKEDPEVELPPPDFALGGQTGSGRWAPCRDDAQCEQLADEVVAWFTRPRAVTQPGEYPCANVYRAEEQCYVDLGRNFGTASSQRGPFDCADCARNARETDERWSCRQPVCGGEPGDLDVDAGVDCAER